VVVVGSTGYALVKEKRKIEGPSGEHGLAWLWPTGPDGLWARKGRWADW
jgi:hypothetical protein